MKSLLVSAATVGAAALSALVPPPEALPIAVPEMHALPKADWPARRFQQELHDANVRVMAQLAATAPSPTPDADEPCRQPAEALDAEADGVPTLRPDQHLLLRGCFGAGAGTLRLAGSELPLAVLAWGPRQIHAQVPPVAGVFDRNDLRLQVLGPDGRVLAEWPARFRARRALHELQGEAALARVPALRDLPAGAGPQALAGQTAVPGQQVVGLVADGEAPQHWVGVLLDVPVGTDPSLGLPSARFMASLWR